MILRRLHLHPFAGAADREVILGPGLNVVLGPNEAGKSTLRRALRQVLFVPTKLGKRESEARSRRTCRSAAETRSASPSTSRSTGPCGN